MNGDAGVYCNKCLTELLPLLNLNNNHQFALTLKGIDFPEDLGIDDFLSSTQLNTTKKINNVINKGFDINNDNRH